MTLVVGGWADASSTASLAAAKAAVYWEPQVEAWVLRGKAAVQDVQRGW